VTSERDAIAQTYADYFRAFQTLRLEAVVGYYHVPCLAISPQGVSVMTTIDEIHALIGGMQATLKARGYGRSEWANLHVKQLSDQAAVVSTMVLRYKTDGTELERFGATYALRRTEAGWKIVVLTIHDPDTVLEVA
jgi:ketosteroid isomerase-like protein